MSKHVLPQRDPFTGPPVPYTGATVDVVELFADALREWSTTEPPRTEHHNRRA
ncbi:hypothetical protein ACWEO2_29085 [Nocardia sp. NPDC004278]